MLKLIISSLVAIPSQVNIAEVSSAFHQADWSITLVIVYCLLFLLVYLFLAQLDYAQMQTSAQFKFALCI